MEKEDESSRVIMNKKALNIRALTTHPGGYFVGHIRIHAISWEG